MSIDTNAPYKVPEKYQPKNKNVEPKMKKSAVFMIFLGWFLNAVITIAIGVGIVFGVIKIVEAINSSNQNATPETSVETNQA